MKRIITALLLTSVLFLVSCSDFEQESSPIAPEFQKVSSGNQITEGAYQYLQCLEFIPVQYFASTKTPGTVDIVISPDLFPKFFLHMYVVLEYKNIGLALSNKMIFVGKPNSNIIQLNGVHERSLTGVKVYVYVPGNHWQGISPPYNYLTSFEELTVNEWTVSNNQILIFSKDWNPNLSDTFIEFTFADKSRQNHVLTYIANPTAGKITLPKFMKDEITQIRMYGLFNNTQF